MNATDADQRPEDTGARSSDPGSGAPDDAASHVDISLDDLDLDETTRSIIERLALERDQAVAARQRALADFRNFQRRAAENEIRAGDRAAASVVRSLLPVLDHFELAIEQVGLEASLEQLLEGVDLVRQELLRVLAGEGVARIAPEPGDEFDPTRHKAVMRQRAEEIAPNHIVAVLQPGYAIRDVVLRAAVVTVAPEPEEG